MTTTGEPTRALQGVEDLAAQGGVDGRPDGPALFRGQRRYRQPRADAGSGPAVLRRTHFRGLDPDLRCWDDRGFAVRAAFVPAARTSAVSFYFAAGRFGTWRPGAALAAINAQGPIETFVVAGAIIAPTYMPRGVIGAVVWASADA
jgi:hypothetical protein